MAWWAILLATLPAILLLTVWTLGTSFYLERHIVAPLPEQTCRQPDRKPLDLALGLVKSLANGLRRSIGDDNRPAFDLRRIAAAV